MNYNLGYFISLGTYFKALFKPKSQPERKFVIYGSGRSGSTLLVSLLDSHSQIYCDNEIYHRKVVSPKTYLDLRAQMSGAPVYGFKLLTYHLGMTLGMSAPDFNPYLRALQEDGYQIIYLWRRDAFRQALSNVYARQSQQFHNQNGSSSQTKIHVDLDRLDYWYQGLKRQAQLEQEYLAGIPHLALTYEDHLADGDKQTATMQEICQFLDIPYEAPQTGLRKNTPKSLESFIKNHQEVEAYLRKVEPMSPLLSKS